MLAWICEKREILHRLLVFISTLSLVPWPSTMSQSIPTYYLDDYCSRVLDMTMANVKSGRLLLHRPGENPRFPSCHILISAPTNKRLSFKFHSFHIDTPLGCTSSFLRIYEDHRREFPITEKLCNTGKVPDRAYITNGAKAAVWLSKENYLLDQVELIFTAFSFSPCLGGDYQCNNNHCISSDLYCNDEYDNCGDESDICLIKHGTVIGIIAAVVVVLVILAIILALYMFRRQRKIRREKVAHILFACPDQKSQLSFISDGKSSTLKKQPSLLSHASSVRYPGVQTVVFTGTKAHSLGYTPLMLADSPMGSQYSTLTRSGAVFGGSSLGEKARSSIRSKPRKFSAGKNSANTLPESLVRKKPSENLRPPFYFDKDGYFSDSSVSQTNSLDKHARRPSLDMTDAKKKKKKGSLLGDYKLKKKTKKGKSPKIQTATDTNEEKGDVNRGFKDYKDITGREQMTEDLYIDGKRLINTLNIPEIRITNAEDSYAPGHIVRKDTFGNGNDYIQRRNNNNNNISDNFPAGTSVKPAEALYQSIRKRKEATDEHQEQHGMPGTAIQPHTITNAVVHRPRDTTVEDATESNDKDNTNIETVVDSPSTSFDTVDGRPQAPVHLSLLTLPSRNPGFSQKESMSTIAVDNSVDEDIETIIENAPTSPDQVDNRLPRVTHISALTLPAKYNRESNDAGQTASSSSNGEDETDSYPQTNVQLANQITSPANRSSLDTSSSLSSGRSLSPTRQMGLSARHPDGSPFLLHKVNRKSVEKQLKQHPEDRADVRDHVISFRSYPSPVPTLERTGLFRNNSRRSTRYSDSRESL